MSDREEEAREYAALGFASFPVHGIVNGNCTCGRPQCQAVAKHPRTSRGFKDATTSQQQIAGWDWSAANVGIRTGSGLLVVDVDPRHGGDETLWGLEKRYGPLPEGPRSETGGGGTHIYFRVNGPVRSRSNRWQGIDLKCDGGYVLAPSSVHESGRTYAWDIGPGELERPSAPSWLLESEAAQERKPRPAEIRGPVPETRRNVTLAQLAGHLWRTGLDRDGVEAALRVHNLNHCRPPETDARIRSIARWVSRTPEPPPWALNPWHFAERVAAHHHLGRAELVLLAALASAAADDGTVTRGVRRLAAETKQSSKTVIRALTALEAAGVLGVTRRDERFGTTYSLNRCGLGFGKG